MDIQGLILLYSGRRVDGEVESHTRALFWAVSVAFQNITPTGCVIVSSTLGNLTLLLPWSHLLVVPFLISHESGSSHNAIHRA